MCDLPEEELAEYLAWKEAVAARAIAERPVRALEPIRVEPLVEVATA